MALRYKPGTRIDVYTLLQFVGEGEQRFLYLANTDSHTLVWLVESEKPLAHLAYVIPDSELLELSAKKYLVFPVKGSSVAALARLVPALDPSFIGWRWVELA